MRKSRHKAWKYKRLKQQRKKKRKKKKKNTKTSGLEDKFMYHILDPLCEKYSLKYKRQFKVKSKYYDFYIPKIRLIIETDGVYYHGKKKNKNGKLNKMQKKNILNDHYKHKLAIKNKHRIIRFWGDDIKESTSVVKKQLNDKIKKLLK